MSAPREAFESALRGDHTAARDLLSGPLEPGWEIALRATLPPGAGRSRPSPDEVRDCQGPDEALALACAQGARGGFARCAPDELRAWRDALALRVSEASPDLLLVDVQLALLTGAPVDLAALEAIEAAALRGGAAEAVVDAAATRALVELERGELEAARGHARRAVRMSRTEELVHQQYLAGVALARVRRHAGQPHIALRILGALERVAPADWRPWLEHERALAGDRSALPAAETTHAALRQRAALAPCPLLRGEIELAMALLDPEHAAAAATRWRAGRVHEVPRGLIALEAGTTEHQALVLVSPGRPAARVLASSAAIGERPLLSTSRPGRIETALSVLALARAPLAVEAFFSQVYGFAFEPRIHRGSLEVLVHRLRELLGDRAVIERELGDVQLVAREAFAVPDPRVRRTLDDAVLRAIAEQPGATARQSAERAGAPLRSVQHALKRLVEGGACEAIKRGRVVCYRVEDTTFTEPTRVLEWRQDPS
ncbi:MAG: hypothetical protein RID81_22095 [Sandaracinaceae bacterium]